MLREFSIGSYKHMKSDNKKEFDMTGIDSDISTKWKPSDGVNWDAIQRRRFMNWDAEVDPDDSFSKKWKKERNE